MYKHTEPPSRSSGACEGMEYGFNVLVSVPVKKRDFTLDSGPVILSSAMKAWGHILKYQYGQGVIDIRVVNKVARWPVPSDQSGVRAFLGTIGMTRRWVKNFAEVARLLFRLTVRSLGDGLKQSNCRSKS